MHENLHMYVQYWRRTELPLNEIHIDSEVGENSCTNHLPRISDVPITNWMMPFAPPSEISRWTEERSMSLLCQVESVIGTHLLEMAIVDFYLHSEGNVSIIGSIEKALKMSNLTHLLPQGNVTVKDLIETWNTKSYINPPVVIINATNNNSLLISQVNSVKWLPITILTSRGHQELIWIPENQSVTYYGSDNDTLSFLRSTEKTVEWIAIVQKGYSSFRVIYDERLTTLLSQQLLLNHTCFSTALRMQLINDYFTCATQSCGGLPLIPIELAMELGRYLEHEMDSLVWRAFRIPENAQYESVSISHQVFLWDFLYQQFQTEEQKSLLKVKPAEIVFFLNELQNEKIPWNIIFVELPWAHG